MITEKTMQPLSGIGRRARIWTALLAAAAVAAMAGMSAAKADDAQAKAMFKAMSDYVSGQKAISFKFDSNLDVVTTEHQKLGLASSGAVTINRPDKIHATRTGGFADVEFTFDGNTMTLLGRNADAYAKVSATGSLSPKLCELIRSALAAIRSAAESARFTRIEPPATAMIAARGSPAIKKVSQWRKSACTDSIGAPVSIK